MLLRNYTPFRPFTYAFVDTRGRLFQCLIIRGTFRIRWGRRMTCDPEQLPIQEVDLPVQEDWPSSVKLEQDLCPFKPMSDVQFSAVACTPELRTMRRWMVRVKIQGRPPVLLSVTGERGWTYSRRTGWSLSDPEPACRVPLTYEHAFGGPAALPGMAVDDQNPVGLGYVADPQALDRSVRVAAPQIEAPDDPVVELGVRHRPRGLAPIFRAWTPRRQLAGTYDEAWKAERHPAYPLDFDWLHNVGSNPDLQVPGYLSGHERVTLEGLHPAGRQELALPGYKVMYCARLRDGALVAGPMVLDTVMFDLPHERAHLTWRAQLGLERPIRVLEARLEQGER